MTTRRRVVEVARKKPPPAVEAIRVVVVPDEDPDTSWMDDDENKDRRTEYERGDFQFVGVRAEADVVVEGILQTLTSAGLWGIESDSGEEYIVEVAGKEYAELRKVLVAVGVPTTQLPTEVDRKLVEWRA